MLCSYKGSLYTSQVLVFWCKVTPYVVFHRRQVEHILFGVHSTLSFLQCW